MTNRDPELAANWTLNELLGACHKAGVSIDKSPVAPDQLGSILDMIESGTISSKIAKELFQIVWFEGGDPARIVNERNMKQVTNMDVIEKALNDLVAANLGKAAQARIKPALAGWFVGQVMRTTGGKANPQVLQALVKDKLGIIAKDPVNSFIEN